MKYAIVYLLRGKTGKYHKRLVKYLAQKFNEKYFIENPIPSHATLKYSFKTNKINEIENLLKQFVKMRKTDIEKFEKLTKESNLSIIKIKKINHFNKKVIYLQLDFSRNALKIYRDLAKTLRKISWLEWKEFDNIKGKFHATLVYGNTIKSFNKIWKFASKIKPEFNLKFDNITIIKKPRKYWKIHKIFRIR